MQMVDRTVSFYYSKKEKTAEISWDKFEWKIKK